MEKSSKTLLDQLADTRARLDQARTEDATQQATIARLEERHAATERVVEQMRVDLPETFKSLASEVLEEKSKPFRGAEPDQPGPGSRAPQDQAGGFPDQDRSRAHGAGEGRRESERPDR